MSGSPAIHHTGETPCRTQVSLLHFSKSAELHSPGPATPRAGCSQCHLVKDSQASWGRPSPGLPAHLSHHPLPSTLPSTPSRPISAHRQGHPPVPVLPEFPQASAPHAWQGPESDVSAAPSQGQSQTAGASSATRKAPRSAPGSLPLQDPDYPPVHMHVR